MTDLRDAVTLHQLTLQAEGVSLATQRNYAFYGRVLLRYLDDVGQPATLDALTTTTIRAASEWYRGQVSPHAARHGVQAVRQFVMRIKTFGNFLAREELIPEGRLSQLKAPRISKLLRTPFTQDEVTAMHAACKRTRSPERDESLLLLLLATGMRIGEAASLRLSKIDLAAGLVTIGETAKGKRERLVPIGSADRLGGGRTIQALRKYLEVRPGNKFDHDHLFLTHDGRRMSATGLSDTIQHLGDLAGVKNPIPHRCRHLFATQYLQEYPGDEIGLRRILGHVSDPVLTDYIHFSQTVISQRAGRVSLPDRWLTSDQPPLTSVQDLVTLVRGDPALRRALLEALTA